MPKPVQPGDKLTISTRKTDALALAWLNSQRNRSEAVMELIRAAAVDNLLPASSALGRRPSSSRARPTALSESGGQTNGFGGLDDFLAGIESMKGEEV